MSAQPLTAKDLAKLAEMEKAATPRPWVASRPEQKGEDWPHGIIVAATARGLGIYASGDTATFPSADRDLIATARNALPALLASAAAAQAMREALLEFLAWFDRQNDGMEGVHYFNGDSDKYAGNGHDDLEKVGSIARAAIEKATKP